ncbi:hypothetical protein BA893_04970 [Vibrio natriegens]|uniref:hypothetical protein n=1 Tax=Vibrio natriegens TaxID=691 RepID=UPI000804790A|nr:hypothetical protein [Vibrio natriegens]ANQ21047.1 hypothetical protein BA893_04970 [Vibrio natriegens]
MNVNSFILSSLALSFLAGCAEPKPVVMKTATITVQNLTSDKISRIVFRQCGTSDDNLVFENIRVGQVVYMPLSVNCADFYAYDRNGKVIGKQLKVEMPPSLQWKITN